MERKFYKTRYIVEILSEDPIPPEMDFKEVMLEAEEGGFSGQVTYKKTSTLNGKQTADALLKQNSSPEFFRLTPSGEDIS